MATGSSAAGNALVRDTKSEPLWWLTKDGDRACLELYEQHYSAYRYKDGRARLLFCGPGEKVPLRTDDGAAFFVWRKFKDKCIDEKNGTTASGDQLRRVPQRWSASQLGPHSSGGCDC